MIVIRARGSNIPYLLQCPRTYVERCRMEDGLSNAAADTGNIFHALAAAHHKKHDAAVAMKLASKKYPLGDAKAAWKMFEEYKSYAPQGAVCVEENLVLTIDDGEYRFLFAGTIDLVCAADPQEAARLQAKPYRQKIERGVKYRVIDHKTGRPSVESMMTTHWGQLSLYSLIIEAASGVLPDVEIHHVRTNTVERVPITRTSLDNDLREIKARLIDIHNGRAPCTPGEGCKYCNLTHPRCNGGGALSSKKKVMVPLFG